MYADCRKCIYFISRWQMTPAEREEAIKWIVRNRPGKPLLGYCTLFERPITYYLGRCSGFHAKQEPTPRKITEFLKPVNRGVNTG
jgi:hypothetical protein